MREEASRPPKLPAFDPDANPQKIKCAGNYVFGWIYPDGTLEFVCREKRCRRDGFETRHLYNPENGLVFNIWVPKHTE